MVLPRWMVVLAAATAFSSALRAQQWPWEAPAIPDARGLSNTVLALKKLPVSARVLFVMGHLDDEGYLNAMLPYASWVQGARTGVMNYFRAGTGHNVLGAEQGDALMIMRTGEGLSSGRYFGTPELYFSRYEGFRVQDIRQTLGTFGRENLVRELVEVIRMFRPHIVVSLWSGTSRDGHGHHEMVGLLTPEAARAAGLPDRYPEVTKQGLPPWRPQKVYLWDPPSRSAEPGRSAEAAAALKPPAGRVFRLDGERFYPLLGRSLAELGLDGFRQYVSQGKAIYPDTFPGNDMYSLRLVDGPGQGSAGLESSLFDGLDPELDGIPGVAPTSRAALGFLAEGLAAVAGAIKAAMAAFTVEEPWQGAPHLAKGLGRLAELRSRIERTSLNELEKYDLVFLLREKERDFTLALARTLGLDYRVLGEHDNLVGGEPFRVSFSLRSGSAEPVEVSRVGLRMPEGWREAKSPRLTGTLEPWKKLTAEAEILAPASAPYTGKHWRKETRWRLAVERPEWAHLPYTPPEVIGRVELRIFGVPFSLEEPLRYHKLDHALGAYSVGVQVAPALSVATEPEWTPLLAGSPGPQQREVKVHLLNNSAQARRATLQLGLPEGWRSEPEKVELALAQRQAVYSTAARDAEATVAFRVTAPPGLEVKTYPVRAVAASEGRTWTTGYQVIHHRASWRRHLYREAVLEAKAFDLKVARPVRVGYISASLDVRTENPAVMERFRRLWGALGVRVELLQGTELYYRNLSEFDCIIVGYYTYERSRPTVANHARLLEFVRQGGLLIVTSQSPGQWNSSSGGLGPYPVRLVTVRVPYDATVELAEHPVLSWPNRITTADFEDWDEDLTYTAMDLPAGETHYSSLVTTIEDGGAPVRGALTVTRYGKGHYVFAGTYIVRQSYIVPLAGPFRLLANVLALAGSAR